MSQSLVSRSKTCLSNVLGHATTLEIRRGLGSYLYDYDDQPYLDFGAGIAVNATGHCHPTVVSAIKDQSDTLLHGCAGVVYYEQNIALAEALGHITDGQLSSVFFTQSGTEAVEAALKCAMYVSKKPGVIAFNGSFHGRTLGALSVTTSNPNYLNRYHLPITNRHILEYPYLYRHSAPLNTLDGYLNYLTTELAKLNVTTIGAMIIEPVIGEGGYIPAPAPVLQTLRDWCTQHNVLLIFDEIQSGIARTGTWFCYQHYDIVPDIITTAKGIASGLPLGACISTQEIMDQWHTGSHGGTYGGNPLACRAGLATLTVLEPLLPTIQAMGKHAMQRLKTDLREIPFIGDIRGIGLMIGIECISDANKSPHPGIVSDLLADCLNQGLLIVSCGIHRNIIRLMPPLTISMDELNQGLDTLIHQCQQRS